MTERGKKLNLSFIIPDIPNLFLPMYIEYFNESFKYIISYIWIFIFREIIPSTAIKLRPKASVVLSTMEEDGDKLQQTNTRVHLKHEAFLNK